MAVTKTEYYGVQLVRGKRYMCGATLYKAGEVAEVTLDVLRTLLSSKEKFSKRPYFKIVLEPGQAMPDLRLDAPKVNVAEANRPRVRSVVADNTDEEGYEI